MNENHSDVLLPLCYLAPIEYYALLLKSEKVLLEAHEHYRKQTWRNRCSIYSPDGRMYLSIPVQHSLQRKKVKDVKIAYDEPWQKIHWRSLEAAYRSSPFFEYYEDDIAPFYEKKITFLKDYNWQLTEVLLELMQISVNLSGTEEYQSAYQGITDYRDYFSKKQGNGLFEIPRYQQVFEERDGYLPNLSIVDLLFNKGPEAGGYLSLLTNKE